MTFKFAAAMRRATAATRVYNIYGATRSIQKALAKSLVSSIVGQSLRGSTAVASAKAQKAKARSADASGTTTKPVRGTKRVAANLSKDGPSTSAAPAQVGWPVGAMLQNLRRGASLPTAIAGGLALPSLGLAHKPKAPEVANGASFITRSFASKAGVREFKLYVPASATNKPKGLILMLHGCTQNPDDFAVGTNMNALAEAHGLLVAYPHQTRASNAAACWNWFEPAHQRRDEGEPAILAGLTQELIAEFSIDKTQVFVAGLSAGAAMAVIIAKTYPDMFRAVGVHSGLAYQSAGNVMSAMAVMRGSSGLRVVRPERSQPDRLEPMRTIIFHGSSDKTVNPSNAKHISDVEHGAINQHTSVTSSGTRNGRKFTRTIISHKDGTPMIENWLINGAGHAWSGGNASGSYADAKGPDASAEMVRFFLMSK
jgi:poly(hydroxyalkanoate) depolymerase family esterase